MPVPGVIAFLHTARTNVDMFRQLVAKVDPAVATRHELLESVLQDAVGNGIVTEAMRLQTETAVQALARDGASIVVCTCSTIGGLAEATPVEGHARVMRIDRPMAEQAVARGGRIVVAATLPSTLKPTIALIRHVAGSRTVEIVERLCADAWQHFELGNSQAYAEAIAASVTEVATADDTVVLAQASMAPAAGLLAARGITAFASPELGVRAAVAEYRRLQPS